MQLVAVMPAKAGIQFSWRNTEIFKTTDYRSIAETSAVGHWTQSADRMKFLAPSPTLSPAMKEHSGRSGLARGGGEGNLLDS